MAPEVYESQGVYTAKVDVYSATLVVFYMITGTYAEVIADVC
jgi:serine/threonine protein kinase